MEDEEEEGVVLGASGERVGRGEVVRVGDGEGVQFPRLVIGAASSGSKNSIYK